MMTYADDLQTHFYDKKCSRMYAEDLQTHYYDKKSFLQTHYYDKKSFLLVGKCLYPFFCACDRL
jgi:hypothetical protein